MLWMLNSTIKKRNKKKETTKIAKWRKKSRKHFFDIFCVLFVRSDAIWSISCGILSHVYGICSVAPIFSNDTTTNPFISVHLFIAFAHGSSYLSQNLTRWAMPLAFHTFASSFLSLHTHDKMIQHLFYLILFFVVILLVIFFFILWGARISSRRKMMWPHACFQTNLSNGLKNEQALRKQRNGWQRKCKRERERESGIKTKKKEQGTPCC